MRELSRPAKNEEAYLTVLYLMYPNGNGYKKDKPIRELKGILSRLDCKKQIIYINNRAKENYECKISENEWEISGDNSCLEFSGWQKGVDFAGSDSHGRQDQAGDQRRCNQREIPVRYLVDAAGNICSIGMFKCLHYSLT